MEDRDAAYLHERVGIRRRVDGEAGPVAGPSLGIVREAGRSLGHHGGDDRPVEGHGGGQRPGIGRLRHENPRRDKSCQRRGRRLARHDQNDLEMSLQELGQAPDNEVLTLHLDDQGRRHLSLRPAPSPGRKAVGEVGGIQRLRAAVTSRSDHPDHPECASHGRQGMGDRVPEVAAGGDLGSVQLLTSHLQGLEVGQRLLHPMQALRVQSIRYGQQTREAGGIDASRSERTELRRHFGGSIPRGRSVPGQETPDIFHGPDQGRLELFHAAPDHLQDLIHRCSFRRHSGPAPRPGWPSSPPPCGRARGVDPRRSSGRHSGRRPQA